MMDCLSKPASPEIINALRKKQQEYKRRMARVRTELFIVFLFAAAISLLLPGLFFLIPVVVFVIVFFGNTDHYVDALYKDWVVKKRLEQRNIGGDIFLYPDEAPQSIFAMSMDETSREKVFDRAMRVINDYCVTGGQNCCKSDEKRTPSPLPL